MGDTLKPPATPKSVSAPKRESTKKFSTKWTIGNTSSEYKPESHVVYWQSGTVVSSSKTDYKALATNQRSGSATSDYINIDRNKWYPLSTKKLDLIRVYVKAQNSAGSAESSWRTLTFKPPKKPEIKMNYDGDSGKFIVELKADTDNVYDYYRMEYKIYRQDKKSTSSRYADGKKKLALNPNGKEINSSTTKDSITLESNVEGVMLQDGASITFTVEVTAKGFAGDTKATDTYLVSTPERAKIQRIELSNKNILDLSKSLLTAEFATGNVLVYYKSAENKENDASYDKTNPTKYTLERIVTPYAVNTPLKASVQDGWEAVDTNEGTPSEKKAVYRNGVYKKYTKAKYSKMGLAQYWTAYDKKKQARTKKFGAWKKRAYKQAKYKVNGKMEKRYSDFEKHSQGNVSVWRCYDKKAKKQVTKIPIFELDKYKNAKYTVTKGKGKNKHTETVARYKNFVKTGASKIKLYTCYDNQKRKTVKNVPEYNLNLKYKAKNQNVTGNSADGVMGEPTIDVLQDMDFTETGAIYDKRVWYRIKCERFGQPEYSKCAECEELRAPVPSADEDYCGFMRICQNPLESGTSILGTVGWDNADKTDEGVDNPNWRDAKWTTMVEYSTHEFATNSNENPSEIEINWKNSKKKHGKRQQEYAEKVSAGEFSSMQGSTVKKNPIVWNKSADFALYGLEPGVPIYMTTRRHMVLGEYDLYGPRTKAPTKPKGYWPFVPVDDPTEVSVFVDEYYRYGDDLTVSWSHNAVCDQKNWVVYLFPAETKYMRKYSPGETNVKTIPLKLLEAGSGIKSYVTIPGNKLTSLMGENACVFTKKKTEKAYSIVSKLGVAVGVSTGGREVLSISNKIGKYIETTPITIVHQPTVDVWVYDTITIASMRTGYVFTNSKNVRGLLNVYANDDVTVEYPDRTYHQAMGECVFSADIQETDFKKVENILTPDELVLTGLKQKVKNYQYVAVVNIPASNHLFLDGHDYTYSARTISTVTTEFASEVAEMKTTCSYSHKASRPGAKSRIEATDNGSYLMDTRNATKKSDILSLPPTATIYCAQPTGEYKATDRCQVYRVTPDGAVAITGEIPFESIVVDHYAPFSKFAATRYIVASVARNGTFETREVLYSLKRHGMRFDWGETDNERSIELPFDIQLNPAYDKSVNVETYIDGSIRAQFNPAVTKTESVSTKLVRLENPFQFEMVRELAQYPGTCFFRAHDGSAYECVANVTGLSNSYDSQVAPVSIELTRVTTGRRFMPDPTIDITYPS